jgi:hypothetical protein
MKIIKLQNRKVKSYQSSVENADKLLHLSKHYFCELNLLRHLIKCLSIICSSNIFLLLYDYTFLCFLSFIIVRNPSLLILLGGAIILNNFEEQLADLWFGCSRKLLLLLIYIPQDDIRKLLYDYGYRMVRLIKIDSHLIKYRL